ncbi:MAG: hypothetical protein KIS66_02095 [Fimbriimonadaceae bacterium]|nr:hypothetical protein [Fimbriimonadaceae bacterium]
MTKQLPENANLEHLRAQAKALLRSLRANDPAALDQARALNLTPPFQLAHAHLATARAYGFPSWTRLKSHVSGLSRRRDAFFDAIRAGDRMTVARLLDQDPDLVRSLDPRNFMATPLNAAAQRNDVAMADLLLEHGADPNARSGWWAGGFTPLELGDERFCTHLIERGAILGAHACARLGWVDELRRLVSQEPGTVHERGGDGQTPLHYAKTPDIVDILLDAGADTEIRDLDHEATPVQTQVLNVPVVRRLVERGTVPDVYTSITLDDPALLGTILDEDPDAVERRVNEPGDPKIPPAPGRHAYVYSLGYVLPFQAASKLGRPNALRVLFERSSQEVRLLQACWEGDRPVVDRLLATEPGLVSRLTPRHAEVLGDAAWFRRTETVRLMLDIGVPLTSQDREGFTPLMRCAFFGYAELVEAMLAHRPDLTPTNVYGGTALNTCLYGSENGWRHDGDFPRTIRLLLEAGSPRPARAFGSAEARAVLREFGVPA